MDIRQLLNLPDLLEVKSVLCIEPHPDDNEVGAAGTIAQLVERGCRVDFVTVTDGGAGWTRTDLRREDIIATRSAERKQAAELLGVNKHYHLGFEDGGSYAEEQVLSKLIPLFRELKPELVMTVDPWMPYEAHPDHIKTGRAVAAAMLFSSNPAFMEGTGEPWAVPQIAFYATSYPNTFIDVTATWQQKMEAILAHKSQFDNEEWPLMSQYFQLEASQVYAQSIGKQSGAVGAAADSAGKTEEADGVAPVGDDAAEGDEASAQVPQGFAEAFKLLSSRQLHFFPSALYS